jgi:hypothetical protein
MTNKRFLMRRNRPPRGVSGRSGTYLRYSRLIAILAIAAIPPIRTTNLPANLKMRELAWIDRLSLSRSSALGGGLLDGRRCGRFCNG